MAAELWDYLQGGPRIENILNVVIVPCHQFLIFDISAKAFADSSKAKATQTYSVPFLFFGAMQHGERLSIHLRISF